VCWSAGRMASARWPYVPRWLPPHALSQRYWTLVQQYAPKNGGDGDRCT
jgi:hypothetical protein